MVLEYRIANEPTALWVIPVADVGGVARHVLDCARQGIPGWKLVVLCPPGYLAQELARRGAAVVTGDVGPAAGMMATLRTVQRVRKSLRPKVVHSHLAYADMAVMLDQGINREYLSVSTEHGISGDDSLYQRSRIVALLKRGIHHVRMRRTGRVIAVSEATADAMRLNWNPPTAPTVIPNGVDPASAEGLPRQASSQRVGGPRILTLSRLSREKNIDLLLQAFPHILAALPAATLTVAGEGPERSSLQSLAADLGVHSRVTFKGVMEPATAMRQADVLMQLSSWENCSYTILDAVVAGLDVVATDVGGNAEILGESSLVRVATPKSLAEKIVSTWGEPYMGLSLPGEWPTVREMCARIADIYEAAVV